MDFWEPSEGRGSHSSLKREEERRMEVRLHQRGDMYETTRNKETGTRLDMLKKHLQATLVNLIKLESGQTHPAHIFGGFHVFLHKKEKKKKIIRW